jgi:hypothetical protein
MLNIFHDFSSISILSRNDIETQILSASQEKRFFFPQKATFNS